MLSKLTARELPAGWKMPAKPKLRRCGTYCGEKISAGFLDPVCAAGRLLPGTGLWIFPDRCSKCDSDLAKATEARAKKQAIKDDQLEIHRLTTAAGFFPIHEIMRRSKYEPGEAKIEVALEAYSRGEGNVFAYGPAGTGKTHFAVRGLSQAIAQSARPGRFELVPELFLKLRKAAKDFEDERILKNLCANHFLVLDDLGSERPTAFVLEALYIIVDRWYRMGKSGLIVTSNLSPAQLSERVDDRLISRLVGMSTVLKFTGRDRRIS